MLLNYCKIITTKCGKEKTQQHMYSTSKNITFKVDTVINLEDLIINNWRLKKNNAFVKKIYNIHKINQQC